MPGPFSILTIAQSSMRYVGRYVVAQLQEGLPDSDRPPPLLGPALTLPGFGKQNWDLPPLPAPPHQAEPEPQHAEDGCPACKLHSQMADARGLADRLAMVANPDGSLPHPQAGTLPLIQVTLRQAAGQVQTLAASRPDLAPRADALQAEINDTAAQVPVNGEGRAEDAKLIAVRVNQCWLESCELAEAYWSPPPPSASNIIRGVFRDTRQNGWDDETAMARLQEVISGGEPGAG